MNEERNSNYEIYENDRDRRSQPQRGIFFNAAVSLIYPSFDELVILNNSKD